MPRPPQIHFRSPDDPRFKEKKPQHEAIPRHIVQGIVRGLLNHLWNDKRRTTKEMGVDQDKVERGIMVLIDQHTSYVGPDKKNLKSLYDNRNKQLNSPKHPEEWHRDCVASLVPAIFTALTGHTSFVLKDDSDLILKELDSYKNLKKESAERYKWLKNNLPRLLGSLKQATLCTECKGTTIMPDQEKLKDLS